MNIIRKDHSVYYDDSQATKDAVFKRVLKFFAEHEKYFPEQLLQDDDVITDAPTVLAELSEIIKFIPDWFEEDTEFYDGI